jgi:hypothetical protein
MNTTHPPRSLGFLVLFLLLPLGLGAQEVLGFDQAMENLAKSLAASGAAAKPIRLAFLPLAAQGKAAKADSGFGAFAADQLAIKAKKASPRLRVFERARLSDILAENELSLSGLIDADQAMQVGSLAPVDALATGSYAADSSSITFSVRLVSVVSGEVLFSQTLRSAIDSGAAAFFGPEGPVSAAADAKDKLRSAIDGMKRRLSDISTDGKLDKAVAAAAAYPLFGPYARVHSLVCETLGRYGKRSARYRAFLIDSFEKAELIEADDDVYVLLDAARYMAADGADDQEFQAILDAAAVLTAVGYYSVVFQYAFGYADKAPAPQAQAVDARVDAAMARAKSGGLGRPAPIDPGLCLDELIGALRKNGRSIARAYRLYAPLVKGQELERNRSSLKRAFDDETDPEVKRDLLSLIADNYQAQDFSDALADRVWDFAQDMESEEGYGDRWAAEFAALCPKLLAKSIPLVPYSKDERVEFCLRYGIDVPGFAPALADLKRDLAFGATIDDRRRAAALLVALGPRAAPAEDSVRQTLRFIQDGSIAGMGSPNLQMECYSILSALPEPKAETMAALALGLDHAYSDVREAAAAAIEKIGERALPYLRPRIASGERTRREDALRLVARMGKRAGALAPDLEKAAAAEKDEYMKGLILDTLSRVR